MAFALFGVLQGMKSGIEHVIAATRADLLLVHADLGLADSLPVGLMAQIRSVPGIHTVVPVALFGSTYQRPTQKIGMVALRPEDDWLDAFTYTMTPQTDAAFRRQRTATVVRTELAKKYGWKVGDRIPLQTTIAQMNGSTTWSFDIVGTYTDTDVGGGDDIMLINYDYFDEARALNKGELNHFNVAIKDPSQAVSIGEQIDQRFANSPHETRTDSLRELAQSEMQSIGDVNFLVGSIVGTVFIALLFATANLMMQSLRERTAELAVLKTLGFSNRGVFLLVLCEASVLCMVAALCGLAAALLAFPFAARFVPGLSMPLVIVLSGIGLAELVALVSAGAPAIHAARLNVVSALAAR
ncbi:MAG: ABC transporter permease [Sinobacteraceae bacterium]|nr:ABC transporter permease [Nevskiaceae bacterium]